MRAAIFSGARLNDFGLGWLQGHDRLEAYPTLFALDWPFDELMTTESSDFAQAFFWWIEIFCPLLVGIGGVGVVAFVFMSK